MKAAWLGFFYGKEAEEKTMNLYVHIYTIMNLHAQEMYCEHVWSQLWMRADEAEVEWLEAGGEPWDTAETLESGPYAAPWYSARS